MAPIPILIFINLFQSTLPSLKIINPALKQTNLDLYICISISVPMIALSQIIFVFSPF